MRQELARDIPVGDKEKATSTGASTPVSVKIKRIERGKSKDLGPSGTKFQPTLKSFMEIRCGLVGGRGKTGHQEPGKPSWAGRDPRKAGQGPNLSLLGEAGGKEGARTEVATGIGQVDRRQEARPEDREQGSVAPSPEPERGKMVASKIEAFEGKVTRGGRKRRKRS